MDTLEMIFSHFQCLPVSQKLTKKSKGFVWRIQQYFFIFHINSRFYKIESLSKESKETKRPHVEQTAHHPLKSRKVFAEDLWRFSGLDGLVSKKDEIDRQKRQTYLQHVSMATKNKRKPS
ncbi:hypothetical protein J3R82DRAFT_3806 [Butyriboletus roseoflavus]|nr:hypothetical protein J3R82DRAFT_3806 [Butyriboletus roseoflavus]